MSEEASIPARAASAGAAWGEPLARFDGWLTRVESTLCAVILVLEILALCFWIMLKGLASASAEGDLSGLVLRALLTSIVLGVGTFTALRPKPGQDAEKAERTRMTATLAMTVLGLFLGRAWVGAGSVYFSNLLNWYQNASILMLIGGLSGLATRLTLWVALLGASIATAKGKHINVDVVMRFLPERFRVVVAVIGWVTAAAVCTAGAWGFVDFIAVANFKLPTATQCPDDATKTCPMPAGRELGMLGEEVGRDLFMLRRQLGLDLRSFPRVAFGADYNRIFTNGQWNAWIKDGDWEAHFDKEEVGRLYLPEEMANEFHTPVISVPGGGEGARGLLIRDFDFIFPFGLLMIAFRFLLRSVLAISGHVKVDPDAMHVEDDVHEPTDADRKAAHLPAGGAS
jgi:TRAP-type C4-dicarboxylate transport system permease small subunit